MIKLVEVMGGFEWADVKDKAEVLKMDVRYIGTDYDADADIYEEQATGKFLAVVNSRLNGGEKMEYKDIIGIEVDQFNEIMEGLKYYDDVVYYMDDFNAIYSSSAYDAILAAFHGGRFGFSQDSFNPNDEYFIYDGYENLVSIPSTYLQVYMNQFRGVVLEYVNDNEIYLDGVDEYEFDGR
jgi:hypothetical protein